MSWHLSKNVRVVIVPGLHGSGKDHWQSRWERLHPSFRRVEQGNWGRADLDEWTSTVAKTLSEIEGPVLIAAHSFGCLATLQAIEGQRNKVAGALLVAPADPARFSLTHRLAHVRVPCRAVLVGSQNDPWMAASNAERWAGVWGCEFVNAGALGHINADSGLGDWEFGLDQLQKLACKAASNVVG
jgi:predicted alpha/beta hydrolase family esterase